MGKTKNFISVYTTEGDGKGKMLSVDEFKKEIGFNMPISYEEPQELDNLPALIESMGITEAQFSKIVDGNVPSIEFAHDGKKYVLGLVSAIASADKTTFEVKYGSHQGDEFAHGLAIIVNEGEGTYAIRLIATE